VWLAKMAIGIQIKQLADMLQFGLSPHDTDFMLCLLRSLVVFLTRIFAPAVTCCLRTWHFASNLSL
jgi:hypothetical protein